MESTEVSSLLRRANGRQPRHGVERESVVGNFVFGAIQ